MKRSPLLRKTPLRRQSLRRKLAPTKPRAKLRQVSTRRRGELKEYTQRRVAFLERPENRWCPVAAAGLLPPDGDWRRKPMVQRLRTTSIHHSAGRIGKLLNDEGLWIAVSDPGHEWIHRNGREARSRGWLI